MKTLLKFDALFSQNGDDLPEIILRKDDLGVSILFTEDEAPGRFFLEAPGKFILGKTSVFAQSTISAEGYPYDIVFDLPAYEPNKILMQTILPGFGNKNGLLKYTPIIITVEVEEEVTAIEQICLNKAKNLFIKNGIDPNKFLK